MTSRCQGDRRRQAPGPAAGWSRRRMRHSGLRRTGRAALDRVAAAHLTSWPQATDLGALWDQAITQLTAFAEGQPLAILELAPPGHACRSGRAPLSGAPAGLQRRRHHDCARTPRPAGQCGPCQSPTRPRRPWPKAWPTPDQGGSRLYAFSAAGASHCAGTPSAPLLAIATGSGIACSPAIANQPSPTAWSMWHRSTARSTRSDHPTNTHAARRPWHSP